MIQSAWLFVGFVGLLVSAVALYTDVDEIAMVSGAIGTVTFGVWTFGTLNVEVADGGVVFSFSMPALTMLGLAWGLVPLYILLTGPIQMIGKSEDLRESGDPREL